MAQNVIRNVTDVLEQCSSTASQVYRENMKFRDELLQLLTELEEKLNDKYEVLMMDQDAKNFDFSATLQNMIHRISIQFKGGLDELTKALDQKQRHLNSFTLSLFGKQKLGRVQFVKLCLTEMVKPSEKVLNGQQEIFLNTIEWTKVVRCTRF